MKNADSVVLLSDLSAERPEEQDARNLLRLIAIKSHHPEIPCLVQLIQFQSTVRYSFLGFLTMSLCDTCLT